MKAAHIDEQVKAAVRAWGRAPNVEAAARALTAGRRALPDHLRPQLVSEIAEISAELMVNLLCRTDGLDPSAAAVEVEGEALHPKQAERLGAWIEDQRLTAAALGLEAQTWLQQLERGFERYGARARGEEPEGDAPSGVDPAQAKRLLGAARASFEARPEPGKSKQAGLTGLLAARTFGKKQR